MSRIASKDTVRALEKIDSDPKNATEMQRIYNLDLNPSFKRGKNADPKEEELKWIKRTKKYQLI